MKQSLQFKLSQQLTLTPQLRQSIRLLQLSTLELDQEIETYLRDNPLLEREEGSGPLAALIPAGMVNSTFGTETPYSEKNAGDDQASNAATSDADFADFAGYANSGSSGASATRDNEDDDGDWRQQAGGAPTLREHLLSQLALLKLSDRDRVLAGLLVESLDDDGYLTQSLEELLELMPAELDIEAEEILTTLRHVQHLDPAGVGARNVSECLALQVKALPEATPYRERALDIVARHLDLLATKDFVKLKRELKCDDAGLRAAHKLIINLNPKPGREFGQADVRYIIPDVNVNKIKGLWIVALNHEAMPKLRVNQLYANILSRARGSSQGLSEQLQEARWLIKNIAQRFDTIVRVSQAIVDRQRNFFEHGAIAMRPLVLREIADTLGLHESTVSRVTTNKFMRSPGGIFELKFFFSSHVGTDAGGAASSTAIRELIKHLIECENTRKPLSDAKIAALLAAQGMVVARRTVAKYRESMHILAASLRKSI